MSKNWYKVGEVPKEWKDGREVLAFGIQHGAAGYTPDEKITIIAMWQGYSNGHWVPTRPTSCYYVGFNAEAIALFPEFDL